ncbi:alpha/beta fold hydrolase [Salinifilum aidingensis]
MSGPAEVVLLHGVGLDRTMWERVGKVLAPRCAVRAPDLLGHGRAPDAEPGTTLADLAAPLHQVVPGSTPVHLVGFSLGALVATRFALDHPEQVASLTLVSGVAGRSAEERAAVRDRLAAARRDLPETFEAAVQRWFSPQWRAAEPELVERVRAVLRANRPTSYLACYAVFAEADAELWPSLPHLSPRVAALTGAGDPGSTPEMSAAVADRVPRGQWTAVPGARHLLPLECPGAVADAILANVGGRPLVCPSGA